MAIIRTYTIRYPVCVCLPMQKMCVHRHGCGSTSRLTPQTWQVSRANTLHSWLQSYYQHGQKKKGNKTHKLIKPGWLSLTLSQEEDHFPADTVGGPEKLSDPPVFMLGNPTPNATTSCRADSVLCFRVYCQTASLVISLPASEEDALVLTPQLPLFPENWGILDWLLGLTQ